MARLGQFRRDTMANWKKENPIIADGEFILIANDSNSPHSYDYWACGDGTTEFINLKFKAVKDGTGVLGITDELSESSGLALSSKGAKKVIDEIKTLIGNGTKVIKDILVSELDFDYETLLKIAKNNYNTYYNVCYEISNKVSVVCGSLVMFSDSSGHMINQIFFTNFTLSGLNDKNYVHSDELTNIYIRKYHIGGGTSSTPPKTWSDWDYFGGDVFVKSMENLNEGLYTLKQQVNENKQSIDDLKKYVTTDKNLEKRMLEIEKVVFPLDISFSLNKTLLEYTGVAQSVIARWMVKRKGLIVTPTDISLTADGQSVSVVEAGSGQAEVAVKKIGTVSFIFNVTAEGIKDSSTINCVMVCPMYFGFADVSTVNDLTITSLVKQSIKTSPNGSYTLTSKAASSYFWLCVPSTMTINKVTLNGFDVPMEAAATSSLNIGGIAVNYKCYRNSNALVVGTYTFVIS